MQDLADAGKKSSDGWVFVNSFKAERSYGGNAEGRPPLESGASQNDMDLRLALASAEGVLFMVPEPKNPHGVGRRSGRRQHCGRWQARHTRNRLQLRQDEAANWSSVWILHRVAPRLEQLLVIVAAPSSVFAWPSSERSPERDQLLAARLEAARKATVAVAARVDVQLTPELRGEALAALCATQDIDLLVFSSRSFRSISILWARRRRAPIAVLWTSGELAADAIEHIGRVALDGHARASGERQFCARSTSTRSACAVASGAAAARRPKTCNPRFVCADPRLHGALRALAARAS